MMLDGLDLVRVVDDMGRFSDLAEDQLEFRECIVFWGMSGDSSKIDVDAAVLLDERDLERVRKL